MARQWVQTIRPCHSKWYRVYRPVQHQPFDRYIALDWQGWCWLTTHDNKPVDGDIGPFESKEAAAACFEIMK